MRIEAAPDPAEAKSSPNIVMVYVDDAGYADFPYFSDGHLRTPNIDRLCREGIRFTQFYVNAPICSPSRVAIMTGQFPIRWGITSFIASRQENANRGVRNWLDPKAPSLARLLKSKGYATGHFGKWHLGGGRDIGDAPLISEYGFDESLTQFEGLGDRILPLLNDYDGKRPRKMPLGIASAQLGKGDVSWIDRSQQTRTYVRRTIDFIERAQADAKPFYVNVWPDDVHTPLHPPRELRGDGDKRDLYLGVLENMDRSLATLFNHIRDTPELRDNTLIIVASDNGFEPGAGSAANLKGSKGSLYEGGIREPLVVWGPGLLKPESVGSTNDETVISSVDVFASLLTIAGIAPPAGAELDGEDLSQSLLGGAPQVRQRPLYWVRPPDRAIMNGVDMPDLAIRDGRWKLLLEADGADPQLYDVLDDPAELKNLTKQQPQELERLQAALLDWRRTVEDSQSQRAERSAKRALRTSRHASSTPE